MPASSPSPTVTIDDVAKAAGVHPATVSRALRGISGKVSPEKRAEIERVARDLGYMPNAVAASLRTKRTNLAAIVVPDLSNPLFGPVVQGIEQSLRQHKMLCLVVQTPARPQERHDLVQTLANSQVSGLLVFAAEHDDAMLETAKQRRLPTILVNRGMGNRDFSSVVSDDRESARLVLEHLRGLGHTDVAHLAGPATSSTGRARREAFESLAKPFGVRKLVVIEAAAFTRDEGRQAAEKLLAGKARPTAVFAANDLIALGALDVFKSRGLKVPEDLSLVGHNDMPLVDLIDPPLTTVHVAVDQMSAHAAALFFEHLKAPETPPSTRVLLPTLVVRASTTARR